jgi:hypothetical protein
MPKTAIEYLDDDDDDDNDNDNSNDNNNDNSNNNNNDNDNNDNSNNDDYERTLSSIVLRIPCSTLRGIFFIYLVLS